MLLSLLMACLLLPTSFSQPNGLDAAAVNDGCSCHGEQEWSVGIATDDSDLEDDWFPGITYEMRFRATEEAGPPNEPSAMIHVMVDVGEFDIDNLAVDHIMESLNTFAQMQTLAPTSSIFTGLPPIPKRLTTSALPT